MFIIITQIVFWMALLAIMHTYVFYPFLVIFFSRNREENNLFFKDDELPKVSIIMAVHNEEKVIVEKIESVLNTNYPKDKITFYIGSDASTDGTDEIIKSYSVTHSTLKFKRFNQRCGKIRIINEFAAISEDSILVLTDANAILSENALKELVKHFKKPEVQVVGGRLHNRKSDRQGVIFQEHTYMESEFKLKIAEGKLWGSMMGAYGAFYGIRKDSYVPVPDKFMVDDFFISFKAIEKGGQAICAPEAIAYEDVPGDLMSEFKRKTRIATGNFQNLAVFFPILFKGRFGLAFSFFSHKVLRWLGPIFLFLVFICSVTLFNKNIFYATFLIIMSLSLLVPFIDFFHRKSQIHVLILRFITHFYYMNAALFIGLLNYLKGVKSNVWEPTKR